MYIVHIQNKRCLVGMLQRVVGGILCVKGTKISHGAFPLHIEHITKRLIRHLIVFQEGDVIELCQVSDIRAGGLPKVSVIFYFIGRYDDISECFVRYFALFCRYVRYV